MRGFGLGVLLSIISVSISHGELVFENVLVEGTANFGAEAFPFGFRYSNEGDSPIRITGVSSSCGCTTTALESPIVEAGSSGVISGVFHLGDRKGLQEKTIRVRTDHPSAPEVILRLKVTIPNTLTISPRLLLWRVNDQPEERVLQLSLNPDAQGEIISISSDDPAFSLREEVDQETGATIVYLRPLELAQRKRSRLVVVVQFPDETQEHFEAHLMVR